MHDVILNDSAGLVDRRSIGDFIDLIYGGPPSKFIITLKQTSLPERPDCRGRHRMVDGCHLIEIFMPIVKRAVDLREAVGGNNTIPSSEAHGAHLVLAHELRHGWQHHMHRGGDINVAFRGRYRGRAGEIDARRHVDENAGIIDEFIKPIA